MNLQLQHLHITIVILLSIFTAYCIISTSLIANIILLIIFLIGILIVGVLNNGITFYNERFLPYFIFITLIFLILSHTVISITGIYLLDEILFIPFLICTLISTAKNPVQFILKIKNNLIWFFLITFCMAGFWSTYINHVPINIAIRGGMLISKPIILFLSFLIISMTPYSKKKLFHLISLLFVSLTILSIGYSIVFEFILSNNPIPGKGIGYDKYFGLPTFRSFYTHPGAYSAVMIVICNYFFSVFLFKKSKKNLFFLALSIFCLFSTFKAKVIILFPFSCFLIWLIFSSQKKKNFLKDIPIKKIFIFGFGIFLIFSATYLSRNKLMRYTSSETVRNALFFTSLRISENNNWFGAGLGRYGSAISTRFYSPEYYKYGLNKLYGATPDNPIFITDQWWAWYIGETGIIGMICFMAALFLVSRNLVNIYKKNHSIDTDISIISLTAFGSLIYGVGSGFAAGGLSGPPASYLIMGLTALAFNFDFNEDLKLSYNNSKKNIAHN